MTMTIMKEEESEQTHIATKPSDGTETSTTRTTVKEEVSKKTPIANKPSVKKKKMKPKHKDQPKRPMSAYNYFFKEERQRIIKIMQNHDDTENIPGSRNYIDPESLNRAKDDKGNPIFSQMGKLIGAQWKKVTDDQKKRYDDLAAVDSIRYKEEMARFKIHVREEEAKRTSEEYKADARWGPGPPNGEHQSGYHTHGYHGGEPHIAMPTPTYAQPNFGGFHDYFYGGMNAPSGGYYGPHPSGIPSSYNGASRAPPPPPSNAYSYDHHHHHGEACISGAHGVVGRSYPDQSRNDSPPNGPDGSSYYARYACGDSNGPPPSYHQQPCAYQSQGQEQQPYNERAY